MSRSRRLTWYLIFNNSYSGIIKSQVLDRLEFIESTEQARFKIIAIVSPRLWWEQVSEYRKKSSLDVMVIPSFGGLRYWMLNIPILWIIALFQRPTTVIGRSMFATALGLGLKKLGMVAKVVHDGRGAEYAEWREYLSRDGSPFTLEYIERLERYVVTSSNAQLAVSHALINYWTERFNYLGEAIVIPCTINESSLDSDQTTITREHIGFSNGSVVLLLSLSRSDWQALDVIEGELEKLMQNDPRINLLMLSNQDIPEAWQKFTDRIFQTWLSPDQVLAYYRVCDYGLLLREKSITNQVASPVKFAEYIYSGLKVIISSEIGDYSAMVSDYNLGYVLESSNELSGLELQRRTNEERESLRRFAERNLSFRSKFEEYMSVLKVDD